MSRLDPYRSGKVTRASHVSRCPRTCVPRPCDAQPLGAMTHSTGKALSYGNQSGSLTRWPRECKQGAHPTDSGG